MYQKYYNIMNKVAYNQLNDYYNAEEAVQQSFIKLSRRRVFNKICCMKEKEIKYYVLRTVKNVSIDLLRNRYNNNYLEDISLEKEALHISICSIDDYHKRISNIELIRLIELLPDTYRNILLCKVIYDMTNVEIAEKYNINETTVRMRISRARKILRDKARNIKNSLT